MIGTAQSVQGRSRASRGWFATIAVGAVALALGAAPALAGDALAGWAGFAKKQEDRVTHKVETLAEAAIDKKKDGTLDKDALSLAKSGLDGIKSPETETADGRKKP